MDLELAGVRKVGAFCGFIYTSHPGPPFFSLVLVHVLYFIYFLFHFDMCIYVFQRPKHLYRLLDSISPPPENLYTLYICTPNVPQSTFKLKIDRGCVYYVYVPSKLLFNSISI